MSDVIFYGASTLAKLAHYYATQEMGLRTTAFVVDDEYKKSESFLSLPLLSWSELDQRAVTHNLAMHVAIGYRSLRRKSEAYRKALAKGYKLVNVVSNKSYVAEDVVMGDNNIIMPGAVVEPGVTLGSNNVVWSNATICHDTRVGDGNFIASGVTIGGECSVGDRCFLGFSSVILQGLSVGNEVLLGAQSLARNDLPDLTCYYGNPARYIRDLDANVGVEVN